MKTDDILKKIVFVRRAAYRLSSHRLKALELNPIQGGFIRHLAREGKLSQAEISRLSGCDPAATGKTIDCLIKHRWIVKHDHPTDRRRSVITLSPKGKKADAKVIKHFASASKEILSPLSQSEVKVFSALLDKIIHKLTAKQSTNP